MQPSKVQRFESPLSGVRGRLRGEVRRRERAGDEEFRIGVGRVQG